MKNYTKLALLILLYLVMAITPAYCVMGPTLLLDNQEKNQKEFTFGAGPIVRYKHNESSTFDFQGDMAMWGLRICGGPMEDPQFGLMYCAGEQKSDVLKYNLNMTGVSLENSFKSDPRFRWRVTAGVGNYKLKSRYSGHVYNDGTYGFLEPMFLGVLPLNRNIILEFGVGYTFADANGVRVEGFAATGELLLGKF